VTGLPDHLQGLDRPLVVGVVNVTPDSFSDGGEFLEPAAAVGHGLALLAVGADLLDVGGESTRPGADRVPEDEERRRVLPVVRELAAAGAVVSIDSTRATTADAALSAGAVLVNDVSGGLADPAMARLVAEARVPYVVMHSRGPSADMQSRAVYDDVVAEVRAELGQRMDELVAVGVDPAQIVLDPGIGFAKNADHNWVLLSHLDALAVLGRPLLVGVSRKAFLGRLLAGPDGSPRPVDRRDAASAAFAALLADAGIWGLRSHEVAATADAVRVGAAVRSARVGATGDDRERGERGG
jgi:dihydropteroate synthase